jgi:hypothetical protein
VLRAPARVGAQVDQDRAEDVEHSRINRRQSRNGR